MKQEMIVLALAGIALYLIVKNTKGANTGAVNPANGDISRVPDYWSASVDFGSDTWTESINAGANARLKRQGLTDTSANYSNEGYGK